MWTEWINERLPSAFRITVKTHFSITTCFINTEIIKNYIKPFKKAYTKWQEFAFVFQKSQWRKGWSPLISLLHFLYVLLSLNIWSCAIIQWFIIHLTDTTEDHYVQGTALDTVSTETFLASLSFMLVGKMDNKQE